MVCLGLHLAHSNHPLYPPRNHLFVIFHDRINSQRFELECLNFLWGLLMIILFKNESIVKFRPPQLPSTPTFVFVVPCSVATPAVINSIADLLPDDDDDEEIITDAPPLVRSQLNWSRRQDVTAEGNVECVELLLETGCDPDLSTEGGITPLWIAAYERNHLVVKLLIMHGCNIDKIGEFSETDIYKHIPKSPFRIAMERGQHL